MESVHDYFSGAGEALMAAGFPVWLGILLCLSQSAMFSGLNLAIFSVSRLRLEVEATGGNRDALNFLDLDDIMVCDEGEPVDPLSIITVPVTDGRPVLPAFERSPRDPFLRRLDASGKKWVIFADPSGQPRLVLNAHHFLRDTLFDTASTGPDAYWHRPIVVSDPRARLGDVISLMKVKPEHSEDDVIDHDLILVWGEHKRIITGADLLGRLLRGIAGREPPPGS